MNNEVEFRQIEIKFKGNNYINTKEMRAVLKDFENLFSYKSKKAELNLYTVKDGSIDIILAVEVIKGFLNDDNISDLFNVLNQIKDLVSNPIVSGVLSSFIYEKISNRSKFTYDETLQIINYFQENPNNNVVTNIPTLKNLKNISKQIIKRNDNLVIKENSKVIDINANVAIFIDNLSLESAEDAIIDQENRIAYLTIKSLVFRGKEKWEVYDEINSNKAIKLIITSDFKQLVQSNTISFKTNDIIVAEILEEITAKGKKIYRMIRYIEKR